MLSRARVQEILELMRSTKTDAVQFSDYFSEIVAHDAALRERVRELEQTMETLQPGGEVKYFKVWEHGGLKEWDGPPAIIDGWTRKVVLASDYDALLAAPPAVWSREKPTEAGWYWWRRPKVVPRVVEVGAAFGFGGVLVTPSGTVEQLSANDGEWAGPLRPPVEGKGHDL